MKKPKTFLISILNWGLGHATRCMPIIEQLLQQQQKVVIASDGLALNFLKDAFPKLTFETLPAYNIYYPKFGSMAFAMLKQLPGLLKTIKLTNDLTKKLTKKHQVDCIISDNRYGCYHNQVHSIFITHQTNIQLPKFYSFFGKMVNNFNHQYINRFNQLWIPDFDTHFLSGKLSYLKNEIKNKATFIGPLSRLTPAVKNKTNYCTVILSGPEPQRSVLEQKIINQSKLINENIVLVRGTNETLQYKPPSNLKIIKLANSKQINDLLLNSEHIICRSGYSSVMDLVALQQTAFLIPTPGQTEQEYLAKHLNQQKLFVSCSQSIFNLKKAIERLKKFNSKLQAIKFKNDLLNNTLNRLIEN